MTDLEIAREGTMKPVTEIAEMLGIDSDNIELYGKYKAKLPLSISKQEPKGKLILVSAISPTPSGEGKTTVSVGLSQAINKCGKLSTVVLREPSLGPIFGIKGGATGGGYSQLLPMEDINLHFTGDFSAIEKAHNLLAALIDNNIQSKSRSLGIDPRTVVWKRVIDMSDRALRHITIGLGGIAHGVPRETGFDITAASEVMAILCLASDMDNLKERLGAIFVGYTYSRKPIYARDLNAQGAMAVLLKDAIMPNLVQTLENTPAIVHGGPFANIAQGTNTIIATKTALALSDYTITEAGFGVDLGAEKFLDIKCRAANLKPDAVVIVATVRALKYHGGSPLEEITTPNLEYLQNGVVNLQKHIESVAMFGLPAVIAINRFTSDSQEELDFLLSYCTEQGVEASIAEVWSKGGEGAIELAEKVIKTADSGAADFQPLYPLCLSLESKIDIVAKNIYGAQSVEFTSKALTQLRKIKELGLTELPVCIAKTQKSLSDNPKLLGRPEGFTVIVRDIEIAAGAGFIIPITGDIMRMPGLPEVSAAEAIDFNSEGDIVGLF